MLPDKQLNKEISIFEKLRREMTMDTTRMDVTCAGEEVITPQERVIEGVAIWNNYYVLLHFVLGANSIHYCVHCTIDIIDYITG